MTHTNGRTSRGFTLVEVLVTVVVISVGLLGVIALQVVSLRNNHDSYIRTQATALADDIIDRIRSNRDNAASYTVALAGSLTGSSQAVDDVTEWKNQLKTLLPKSGTSTPTDADGAITVTTLATGRYLVEVKIQWGERGTTNPMTFVTTTEV
jgi:type IV pilus assembly protein PilV